VSDRSAPPQLRRFSAARAPLQKDVSSQTAARHPSSAGFQRRRRRLRKTSRLRPQRATPAPPVFSGAGAASERRLVSDRSAPPQLRRFSAAQAPPQKDVSSQTA